MPTHAPASISLAILLLTLAGGSARAQTPPDGQALFRRRCGLCHSIEPGLNMAGPSLAGIVGRKVATVSGAIYSEAMKHHGGAWTPANLTQYLADPQKVVPGTSMTFALPDEAERKAIVAYLETSTPAKAPPKKKGQPH